MGPDICWKLSICMLFMLGPIPDLAAEEGVVPQLYIYADPAPKRGYIETSQNGDSMVSFRPCDSLSPVLVDRKRLKETEGDCKKRSGGGGTWVTTFGETPEGNVILKDIGSGKTMWTFSKEEWDMKISKSPGKFVDLQTGDYVGVTSIDGTQSVYSIGVDSK